MSEENRTSVLTGFFLIICFVAYVLCILFFVQGKNMKMDCYCKVVISTAIAVVVFFIAFFVCVKVCKPKIEYFSECGAIGISNASVSSKYLNCEYYIFVDDKQGLEDGMFLGCGQLLVVKLPNQLKIVPKYAFAGCNNLSELDIPSSVTHIGEYAFLGCSSLTGIQIPASLTQIEKFAFANCRSLKSIVIKSIDVKIEAKSFQGCLNLRLIECGSNPKEYYEKNKDWLDDLPEECEIKQDGRASGVSIKSLREEAKRQ